MVSINLKLKYQDLYLSSSSQLVLEKVFLVNNKKINYKSREYIKAYSSKKSMTNYGSIKTKMYKWMLPLATLWYKIEDHQDLSSSWKWKIFTFSSTMKYESLQIYFLLRSQTHIICAVIDKITSSKQNSMGNSKAFLNLLMKQYCMQSDKVISLMRFTKFNLFEFNDYFKICEL